MTSEREAFVHIQLPGKLDTVPAARLAVQTLPDGTSIGRFRYGDRYLARPDAVALDPFALPLAAQVFEFTALKGIPGAVRDASPDAWGRRVIEHQLARAPADLSEIDYLLHGPQDGAGYLSFGLSPVPPVPRRPYNRTHQLADLIATAEAIEEGRATSAQLLERMAPATSLGGARPKVTIEDGEVLWLGKFPEKADRVNLQRIEHATLKLAEGCGLAVAASRIEPVGAQEVLLVRRFDREHIAGGYLRYGLVSALTALGIDEGHLDRTRWSYPLLADQLRRWSEKPREDCAELFRRMVFNAAITNNDDHPRNHALLRTARGWRLSPAYDLVPVPLVSQERRDLAMTAGQFGRAASRYNLLSQVGRFGLSPEEANVHFEDIARSVARWREVFFECGVNAQDVERTAGAMLPPCFFATEPVAAP